MFFAERPAVIDSRLDILRAGAVAGLLVIQVFLLLVGLPFGADKFAVLVAARGFEVIDVARTALHRIIHGVVGIAHFGRKTGGNEREILIDRQVGTQRIAGGLLPTALRKHIIRVVQTVAASQLAVLETDGKGIRRRVDNVAIDGRRTLDGFHILRHIALHTQVHHRGFGNVHIDIGTEIIAFVVDVLAVAADAVVHPRILARLHGILSVLIIKREGREIAGELTAARDIGAHFFRKRHLAHEQLLPIDIGIELRIALHAHRRDFIGAVLQGRRGPDGIHRFIEHFGAGGGINERQTLARKRETLLITQVDAGRTVETAARIDENNAVGATYAVHSRGAGIFQDTERLDFERIDIVERAFDTIDQNQRIGTARKGSDTTNPKLGIVLARLARGLQCDDARQVTGQRLTQRTHGHAQLLGTNRGDSPHDRFALLRTVTHGDDLDTLHAYRLGLEGNRHGGLALRRDLLRFISDVRYD